MARDLVFGFWHETWASAVERQFMPPDRLATSLLMHDAVGRLIVANPFRSGPTQLARYVMGRRQAQFPSSVAARLFSPMRLRREDGTDRPALERTYRDYDQRLESAAKKLGLDRPALITTNPFHAAYAPLEWAGPVTYYGWDDWVALPVLDRWRSSLEDAYSCIRARGHRVCAVSQPLLDRLDPIGPGVVTPNGITPAEWQPPWASSPAMRSLPGPRMLYVGAIHNRLDLSAFAELSRAFASGSIVVVGPVADQAVLASLRMLSNVHIWGALPRREIAGLIRDADVCLMPHLKNALTVSMSPLKIYEYCAAGRPSVATDLPPVRNIHQAVHLVEEGGSFPATVARALEYGPMPEDQRHNFVVENAWSRRHDDILRFALD